MLLETKIYAVFTWVLCRVSEVLTVKVGLVQSKEKSSPLPGVCLNKVSTISMYKTCSIASYDWQRERCSVRTSPMNFINRFASIHSSHGPKMYRIYQFVFDITCWKRDV